MARGIEESEESILFPGSNPDQYLLRHLSEYFAIPSGSMVSDPRNTDLILDVTVNDYRTGALDFFSLGVIAVPVGQRPKIEVSARLVELQSRKTVRMFVVVEMAGWREYVFHFLTFGYMLGFKRLFNEDEMKVLLDRALHRLVSQMAAFTRR